MEGLEHYHRRELAKLEDLGTPVDRRMFAELVAAEKRLGHPEPAHIEECEIDIDLEIILTSTRFRGARREGFETLRDVVTNHRRRWKELFLDAYLHTIAEGDIRGAAEYYYKNMAVRGGKPPTVKQFAKGARESTNRWFGGDIAALYRAFGERTTVSPKRTRHVPVDPEAFVRRVYSALGGVEVGPYPDDYIKYEKHGHKVRENHDKAELANMALNYLQLEEALGKSPTLQQLGKSRFASLAERALGGETEVAWNRFENVIQDVLSRAFGPTDSAALDANGFTNGRDESEPQPDGRTQTDRAQHTSELNRLAVPVEAEYPSSEANEQAEGRSGRRKPWWRRMLSG